MYITYGTRLFGMVDHVPGLFSVGTTFYHVSGIPMSPCESFVIVWGSDREDTFEGRRIPLSSRSVTATYIRWWGGMLFVGVTLFLLIMIGGIGAAAKQRVLGTILAVSFACVGGIGGLLVAAVPHRRMIWLQIVAHLLYFVVGAFVVWADVNLPNHNQDDYVAVIFLLIFGVPYHLCLVMFGLLRRYWQPSLDDAIKYGHVLGANPKLVEARLLGQRGPLRETDDWELLDDPPHQ